MEIAFVAKIHLEDEVVTFLYCILESSNIGSAQTEFTVSPDKVKLSLVLRVVIQLHLLHDFRCPVRGIVINNENMEIFWKSEHSVNYSTDVLAFFVRGDNDNGVVHRARTG